MALKTKFVEANRKKTELLKVKEATKAKHTRLITLLEKSKAKVQKAILGLDLANLTISDVGQKAKE